MKSNIDRIWNEQDFSELYEQSPKIVNCCTYTIVQLLVGSDHIRVKIPTACPEEIYKFLLYRGLYFHHLNKKTENPLCRTAEVSFFEPVEGFLSWYQLWACGKTLDRNCLLRCVNYQGEESIKRYKPLAVIEQRVGLVKILARSCKDGKYYNISILENQKTSEIESQQLHESYKSFQHPFIAHLCQYHKNNEFSYFIFQHHPHELSQILQKSGPKLTKKQVYVCFIQLLLGLAFLEQQPILGWDISMQMLKVGTDGHIVIAQTVVERTDHKKHRHEILASLLQQLLICYIPTGNPDDSENQTNFKQYIRQLKNKKKMCLKQILGHPWVRQQNIQEIIGKNCPPFNITALTPKETPSFKEITKEQVDKYFQDPYEQYPKAYLFQSYKIACQTSNQVIIKRYESKPLLKIKEDEYEKRLKKTSSSLSLHKKERRPEFLQLVWNAGEESKSPYEAVLKKERKVKKSYLQE